jgi:hypothetical protein
MFQKNIELIRILFLIFAALIAGAIIFWPIIFFGFSTINLIEMGVSHLLFFSLIQIIFILALFVLWMLHKKMFK